MGSKLRYFVIRIVELLITLLIVSLLTFFAFSVIPGDTASVILGPNATEAQLQQFRTELGLDRPIYIQYFDWIRGAFTGDLGTSAAYKQPVTTLIADRLPVTIGMSVIALIMVILISYPMAIAGSRKPGKILDQILSVIGHVLFAIPPFVLSILLVIISSSVFGFFALGRYTAPSVNFGGYVVSLLLPSFCIALPKIAMTFKFLRSSILTEKSSDYVRTAKSHGLTDLKIMFKHILPNSNVSTITVISLVLSDILGGSLIVEQVFNLPGLGRLLIAAISRRDFPLLSGMVLYLAGITVLLYFAADILTAAADPRISLGEEDRA